MCRALGMQGSQLFESADLVNDKYTSSIVTNLKTLQEVHARYSKLSPGSTSSAPSTPRAASGSVSASSPRVEASPRVESSPRTDATSSATTTPAKQNAAPTTPRKPEPLAVPSTPDDVVRARVIKPKPDDDRVAVVQRWLEDVVGKKNTEESLFAWLKSGVILCQVLNVVKSGICKQIYEGPVAFKQLENVQRYLKLVPLAAGPTVPIFSPVDLADENNFNHVVSHIQAMASLVQRDPKWTGPVLEDESAPVSGRVEAAHAALASPRPAEKPVELEEEKEEKKETKEAAPAPVEEKPAVSKVVVEEKAVDPEPEVAVVVAEVILEEVSAEPEVVVVAVLEEESAAPVVVVVEAATPEPEESEDNKSESSEETNDEEKEITETAASVIDIVVADLVLEPETGSEQSEEKLDLGSNEDEEESKDDSSKSDEKTTVSKGKDESEADIVADIGVASAGAEAGVPSSTSSTKLTKVADLKEKSGYVLSNAMLVDLAQGGKAMNRVAAQDELLNRVREILEDLDGRKPKTKAIAGRIGISVSSGSKLSHVDHKTWQEDVVAGKWDSVSDSHRGLVIIGCITEDAIPDHVGYPTKDVHRYARDMIEDMLELAQEDPDLTHLIHADESLHTRSTSKDTASLIYVALKSE